MVARGMGRRAIALFEQYGIRVATGAAGTVRRSRICCREGYRAPNPVSEDMNIQERRCETCQRRWNRAERPGPQNRKGSRWKRLWQGNG